MKLYPAIDIKNGQCVRLRQGVFEDTTVYANEPFQVAKEFEAEGAKFGRKKLFEVVIKYIAPIFIVLILVSSVLDAFGVFKI